MRRVAGDDHSAFEALHARHGDFLMRDLLENFPNAYPNPGLHKDAYQEAWRSVWENAEKFDPERGSFRAWLFTIGRNEMLSLLRKQKTRKRHEQAAAVLLPDAYEPDKETPRVAAIRECVAELASEDQALVRDRYDLTIVPENLPSPDRPAGTIASRLHRLRKKLAMCLQRKGVTR